MPWLKTDFDKWKEEDDSEHEMDFDNVFLTRIFLSCVNIFVS